MAAAVAGGPLPADADAVAKQSCARACESMKLTKLTIFDEEKGAKAWRDVRAELLSVAAAHGQDFVAALKYRSDIPVVAAAAYDDASVLSDNAAGRPTIGMPQMRQEALLYLLKTALQRKSQSIEIIKDCVHCSGTVAGAPQSITLLDQRWSVAELAPEPGDQATELFSMEWPDVLGEEKYAAHMDKAVSMATRVQLNPGDETLASQRHRALWWGVFAGPPESSVFHAAAKEARAVTQQRRRTVADRDAWRVAMLAAISAEVGGRSKTSGVARAMAAGIVTDATRNVMVAGAHMAAQLAAAPDVAHNHAAIAAAMAASIKPEGFKDCPRCPLKPDGAKMQHPRGHMCKADVLCEVCLSRMHASHSCYVANGVPMSQSLRTDFADELRRLHMSSCTRRGCGIRCARRPRYAGCRRHDGRRRRASRLLRRRWRSKW
jgi:hypothetical protein